MRTVTLSIAFSHHGHLDPYSLGGLIVTCAREQAKNIQAVFHADTCEKSILLESTLYNPGYNNTLHVRTTHSFNNKPISQVQFDDVPTGAATGTGPKSAYSYLKSSSFTAVDTLAAASLRLTSSSSLATFIYEVQLPSQRDPV